MATLVHYEVISLSKALATSGTYMWPFTLVAALMAQQCGALAEAAPTVATRIWLLPRICTLVPQQCGTLQEALATLRALKSLLPRVPLEMACKCGALAEALTTHATLVGLSAGVTEAGDHVDTGMVPQPSTAVEGPWALCTVVERAGGGGGDSGGLWRVRPCQVERKGALPKGTGTQWAAVGLLRWVLANPMQQQCRDMREATTTEAAGAVEAAPSVRPQVQVQKTAVTETLATLTADIEGLASMGPPVCSKVCSSSTAFTTL